MPITVKLNYLRIAPRKVRLVADLIRGKTIGEANNILEFTRKKAVQPLKKLLKSSVATAENDFQKNSANLYISKILVNEGPTLKRNRFRAQGRVYSILKRTSHIALTLDEVKTTKIKKKTKAKKITKTKTPSVKTAEEKEEREKKIKKERSWIKKPKKRIKAPKQRITDRAKKMFRRKAF